MPDFYFYFDHNYFSLILCFLNPVEVNGFTGIGFSLAIPTNDGTFDSEINLWDNLLSHKFYRYSFSGP